MIINREESIKKSEFSQQGIFELIRNIVEEQEYCDNEQ